MPFKSPSNKKNSLSNLKRNQTEDILPILLESANKATNNIDLESENNSEDLALVEATKMQERI